MRAMERVLVVPTQLALVHLEPHPDGFHPGLEKACLGVVARHGFFEDRTAAESNPELKQIIPYGMVLWQDQVLLLKRLRLGGETRLYDKASVGVGGHVNPPDADGGGLDEAVARAFERELHEELYIESAYQSDAVGVLNDDSNPVGRVHMGIVYRLELEEPRARVRESERLLGSFVPQAQVFRHRLSLETWSGMLQEHYWPSK